MYLLSLLLHLFTTNKQRDTDPMNTLSPTMSLYSCSHSAGIRAEFEWSYLSLPLFTSQTQRPSSVSAIDQPSRLHTASKQSADTTHYTRGDHLRPQQPVSIRNQQGMWVIPLRLTWLNDWLVTRGLSECVLNVNGRCRLSFCLLSIWQFSRILNCSHVSD